jgi:tetratricopeptide (TPR) repeat protein
LLAARLQAGGRPTADQGVHHAGPGDGNPVALKNLGAILGKEGDSLRALYDLLRSFEIDPQDPQTVYGLAFAYMELGDMEPAQKHFQKVLEMEAPEELRVLARDGLRGDHLRDRHAGQVRAGHQRFQVQSHHMIFAGDFIGCAIYSMQLRKSLEAYR